MPLDSVVVSLAPVVSRGLAEVSLRSAVGFCGLLVGRLISAVVCLGPGEVCLSLVVVFFDLAVVCLDSVEDFLGSAAVCLSSGEVILSLVVVSFDLAAEEPVTAATVFSGPKVGPPSTVFGRLWSDEGTSVLTLQLPNSNDVFLVSLTRKKRIQDI